VNTANLCRGHHISDATIFDRKVAYGGMTTSNVARRRALKE